MTRLKVEDVQDIGHDLEAYDESLITRTGRTLKEIAMESVGMTVDEMDQSLSRFTVGVVPVTSGLGVIQGFTDAVKGILSHIGVKTCQSTATDVGGLAEVIEKGAAIVFLADDERFIAVNLTSKRVIDNAEATARGYVTALNLMAGGLQGCEVLVIGGAGRLGRHAVILLKQKGARVWAFDINRPQLTSFRRTHDFALEENLEDALRRHRILFNAAPACGHIRPEHIKENTLLASPAKPLGLSEEVLSSVKKRLIYDPLQIGVATMFSEACLRSKRRTGKVGG